MKKLILSMFAVCTLCSCASVVGNTNYIPMGPDGLSVQVTNVSQMPVFTYLKDIKEPFATIGMYRVKGLPNNDTAIRAELIKIKKIAASKGANAVVMNQFFDDAAAENGTPVTLAAYFIKYAKQVTEADKLKIQEYAELGALKNASGK